MPDAFKLPFHDWLVELRRHFHQFPELAYGEEKTATRVAEVLKELGVAFVTGVGRTGVVGSLVSKNPGPVRALRADMDALPIDERNEVSYRSRHQGIMHACGHDAHVATALGVVRLLLESGWRTKGRGKLIFIFQPAEEGGAGALAMLDSGVFDGEPIEAVFAGHMHPELAVGHIGVAPEVSNAAADAISIRITGRGGHAAQPHRCIDPIVAGAHLVTQIQTVISRNLSALESAVLTIGCFQAGTARNVIPESAVLEGTLRTLQSGVRDSVLERLEELVKGLEAGHRVTCDLKVSSGYPVLRNDPDLVELSVAAGREILGDDRVHLESPRMGAEDFAYFATRWPGALLRVGCRPPDREFVHGLHSPYFDIDERALDIGVRLFAKLIAG